MQAAGQLEVITSPYTHPKLPLLADTNSACVASPEMSLPAAAVSVGRRHPQALTQGLGNVSTTIWHDTARLVALGAIR